MPKGAGEKIDIISRDVGLNISEHAAANQRLSELRASLQGSVKVLADARSSLKSQAAVSYLDRAEETIINSLFRLAERGKNLKFKINKDDKSRLESAAREVETLATSLNGSLGNYKVELENYKKYEVSKELFIKARKIAEKRKKGKVSKQELAQYEAQNIEINDLLKKADESLPASLETDAALLENLKHSISDFKAVIVQQLQSVRDALSSNEVGISFVLDDKGVLGKVKDDSTNEKREQEKSSELGTDKENALKKEIEKTNKIYSYLLAPAIKKAEGIKTNSKLTEQEKKTIIKEAEAAFLKTLEQYSKVAQASITPNLTPAFQEINKLIQTANNTLVQIKTENLSNEEKKDKPDLLKIGMVSQRFLALRPEIENARLLATKVTDPKMSDEEYQDCVLKMTGLADSNIDQLALISKEIKCINPNDFLPTEKIYLDTINTGVEGALKAMAEIKIYIKRKEMIDDINKRKDRLVYVVYTDTADQNNDGGTEYVIGNLHSQQTRAKANQYFIFRRDGTIEKTDNFKRIKPPEKQQELLKQLEVGPVESVYNEIKDKIADSKDGLFVGARSKLEGGDWQGAKADLLAYLKNNETEKASERLEQCKQMLKNIALREVADSFSRLDTLRNSVRAKGTRWFNSPADYIASKNDENNEESEPRVDRYLEAQEAMLRRASEMIESGQCLTFEQAELSLKGPTLDKPESLMRAEKELDDLAKITPEQTVKLKERAVKKLKDRLLLSANQEEKTKLETDLVELESQSPEEFRYIQRKILKQEIEAATKNLERDSASHYTFINTKLPPEFKAVYDIFDQQKQLSNPDKAVREKYLKDSVKIARDQGFSELAEKFIDVYYANERREVSKAFTRTEVLTAFWNNPNNTIKLNETVKRGIEEYKNKNHVKDVPTEIEYKIREMAGREMVNLAYDKTLRRGIRNSLQAGDEHAALFNSAYGNVFGNVKNLDIYKIEFSDDEWHELLPKIATQLAVMVVAGAVSGGVGTFFTASLAEGGMSAGGAALGGFLMESAAFTASSHVMNSTLEYGIHGRWQPILPETGSELFYDWAEGAATLGLLKGVHVGSQMAGFGALSEAEKLAFTRDFGAIGGTIGRTSEGAARWFARTNLTGVALTSFNAEMAAVNNQEFTEKAAFEGFVNNFVLSAGMDSGHALLNYAKGSLAKKGNISVGESKNAQIRTNGIETENGRKETSQESSERQKGDSEKSVSGVHEKKGSVPDHNRPELAIDLPSADVTKPARRRPGMKPEEKVSADAKAPDTYNGDKGNANSLDRFAEEMPWIKDVIPDLVNVDGVYRHKRNLELIPTTPERSAKIGEILGLFERADINNKISEFMRKEGLNKNGLESRLSAMSNVDLDLLKSNLNKLDAPLIESMINQDYVVFINALDGKPVRVYTGRQLGEGGFGIVDSAAQYNGVGNELTVGVAAKTPRDIEVLREEMRRRLSRLTSEEAVELEELRGKANDRTKTEEERYKELVKLEGTVSAAELNFLVSNRDFNFKSEQRTYIDSYGKDNKHMLRATAVSVVGSNPIIVMEEIRNDGKGLSVRDRLRNENYDDTLRFINGGLEGVKEAIKMKKLPPDFKFENIVVQEENGQQTGVLSDLAFVDFSDLPMMRAFDRNGQSGGLYRMGDNGDLGSSRQFGITPEYFSTEAMNRLLMYVKVHGVENIPNELVESVVIRTYGKNLMRHVEGKTIRELVRETVNGKMVERWQNVVDTSGKTIRIDGLVVDPNMPLDISPDLKGPVRERAISDLRKLALRCQDINDPISLDDIIAEQARIADYITGELTYQKIAGVSQYAPMPRMNWTSL